MHHYILLQFWTLSYEQRKKLCLHLKMKHFILLLSLVWNIHTIQYQIL